MKKWIPIGLIILAVVMLGLSAIFTSPRYQVGDTIYEGKYFDSAYDAYKDEDSGNYKIINDLATIDVNDKFAVWIGSTDNDEFVFAKMDIKNNQYCSFGDIILAKVSDCNSPGLSDEFTLGKKNLLEFNILPYKDFKNKNDKSIKLVKFKYKSQTYVFTYKIVPNTYDDD